MLADYGPLSRADLARLAAVPRGTIGPIVTALLAAKILEESERAQFATGPGKPGRPLWFGRDAGLCGAILVRAGTTETAVVNARGDILARGAEPFSTQLPRRLLEERVIAAAAPILDRFRGELMGIGLALPAFCDRSAGRVVACTTVPGLVDTNLWRLLSDWAGVPVLLEEDARAIAVGERWFGQARGVGDFAALQIDAGIGAGIMLDGHLVHEPSEIGHTCVNLGGLTCRCGLRGCWETIASTRWLNAEAGRLGIEDGGRMAPSQLVRLAVAGDATAARLLNDYADNVAVGIANLAQLLSIRLFILHGEVVEGGPPLRDLIEAATQKRTLPFLAGGVRVVFETLDRDSGLLGAAATVLMDTFGVVM
jgi:predicted NBD/HSP70 family sugar kinase